MVQSSASAIGRYSSSTSRSAATASSADSGFGGPVKGSLDFLLSPLTGPSVRSPRSARLRPPSGHSSLLLPRVQGSPFGPYGGPGDMIVQRSPARRDS